MHEGVKPNSASRAKRLSARRKNKSKEEEEEEEHTNSPCPMCPKLFKTKKYLKKHISMVHEGPKGLKMEESIENNDDSKENKPLNKVPMDISKTKENDFEENDDMQLQLSSDSDEELEDLKE